MNPFYARPGDDRITAIKDALRMTIRWGEKWFLVLDTEDNDWHAFGASAIRKLWAPRYVIKGETYITKDIRPHMKLRSE